MGDVIIMGNSFCIYQAKHTELNVEHLYTVDKNATYLISVRVHDFSGSYMFCILDEDIENYVITLGELENFIKGECEILDSDSDSYIKIMIANKNLEVSGRLGGSHEENFMKYSFPADQTILKLLKDALGSYY